MSGRRYVRAERGTASVEFVGLIQAIILVALIACQMLVTGLSLWSAAAAARAGARAAHIGADPAVAVRRALPDPMRDGARVKRRGQTITARVEVPRLLPGLPVIRVEAHSALAGGG